MFDGMKCTFALIVSIAIRTNMDTIFCYTCSVSSEEIFFPTGFTFDRNGDDG